MSINLSRVGSHVKGDVVVFGIYLPKVKVNSVKLLAQLSHQSDLAWENTISCPLNYVDDNDGYPLFQGQLSLNKLKKGLYRYQYQIIEDNKVKPKWANDPFATQTVEGHRSAFVNGDRQVVNIPFIKVPSPADLIVYECNIAEFNRTFEGFLRKLDYLEALGVNVIEFMPLTNVVETINWGYVPLNFFAPDERFGTPDQLKRVVASCHKRQIAVILDVVYNHVNDAFGYNRIYEQIDAENPFVGKFEKTFGGLEKYDVDFNKQFAREFIFAVNRFYLEEFGVDGFRYDFTPGYYDGFTADNVGLSNLLWKTYEYAKSKNRNIIQCVEHFDNNTLEVFNKTYANACWYDAYRGAVFDWFAKDDNNLNEDLLKLLDFDFLEFGEKLNGINDNVDKSPFTYIENHDHRRLTSYFQNHNNSNNIDGNDYFGQPQADRYKTWFLTQPYVIALFTSQGTPLIQNGQEFGENYIFPEPGKESVANERVLNFRFLRWENTEDEPGRRLLRLYSRLIFLRKKYKALRSRGSGSLYYYNQFDPETGNQGNYSLPKGIYMYKRQSENQVILVALNFTCQDYTVPHPFPGTGKWQELLHGSEIIDNITERCPKLNVPNNYGRIYILQS